MKPPAVYWPALALLAAARLLGTVTMPLRFQPRSMVGDKIYGVWRDELEVQYAVRLGIVGVL